MPDQAARVELLDRWRRFAYQRANKYWRYPPWRRKLSAAGYTLEDVEQIVLLAFWNATGRFDPSRGYSFSTVAAVYSLNAVLSLVGTAARPRVALCQVDDLAELTPAPEPDAEAADALADVRDLLAEMPSGVAEAMRQRYVVGLRLREIAEAEGVSRQAIDQRIQGALAHLRETFNVA